MAKRSAAAAVRKVAQSLSRRGPGGKRAARGTGPTMIQRSREVSPEAKAAFNTEGRVPREFFALSDADEVAIDAVVEAYFDKALGE